MRTSQAGTDKCSKNMDDNKWQALAKSKSIESTSGCNDIARFGEAALEAAKKFFEEKRVIDSFV